MKTWLLSTVLIVLIIGLSAGCSNSINNSITFKNISDGDIFINFRGSIINVAAGQTTVVSNIPKGTYNYSTTYTIPAGASSSKAQGAVSGSLVLNAGTKIQILYSSALLNGVYTISATISNSDSQGSKVTLPGKNEEKTNTNLTGP